MADVFEFQNYRDYLKAYYEEQKTARRNFSYRSFSDKAGINASAFLYYVIQGKRNLTKNTVFKVSTAIGHSREEAEYFENLVFFNQASTISEKTQFYSRIVEARRSVDIKLISPDRYEYYSKWYYSVIREVVTFYDFKDNFVKLGIFLNPPITAVQARDSVLLLEKLGFIERDKEGLYHQTDNIIGSLPKGPDVFLIAKFHSDMLEMAVKSFDSHPVKKRMSASTTFSISGATFELFKMKTREFRKELLEIARLDDRPDQAYQFTFNLFPVSRCIDEIVDKE